MPRLDFVDISHHNANRMTDADAVRASGLCGVIHKATEGTSYVDPTYQEHRQMARDAALPWASYHFLTGSDPVAQMQHYLATVQPSEGERVVLDHEADATLAQLEGAVQYLVATRPDLQVTIYSGHLIKDQLGSDRSDMLAEHTSLWVAQYNNTGPSWPQGTWPVWSAWQYSDQGTVPGVSGAVDASQFNGDKARCRAWFGPATEDTPAPAPQPAAATVTLDIGVPEGVVLDVTVNGEPMT